MLDCRQFQVNCIPVVSGKLSFSVRCFNLSDVTSDDSSDGCGFATLHKCNIMNSALHKGVLYHFFIIVIFPQGTLLMQMFPAPKTVF